MLKMERGAARTAGCNARVVDMEELKKAREHRASSARHTSVQAREYTREHREERTEAADIEEQDSRPFWEQESPFTNEKSFWQQERPFRGKDGNQPERQHPAQKARQSGRPQAPADEMQRPRPAGRRPAKPDDRFTNRPDDRRQTGQQDRRPSGRRDEKQNHAGLYMLLVLLGLLAMAVMVGMKVFEIQDIEVKGAETVTQESIIALSGIGVGENIFKVNLNQAKQNLESDPLVEVLGISRVFPDRIKIDIRQRKPHGAIAYLGSYVIINEKGFVLDIRDSLPVGQYPLITGVEIEPSEMGKRLVGVDGNELKLLDQLLSALYSNKALQYVSEANLADTDKIVLMTGEGLTIDLGKPIDLDKKAQWVACSVPELRSRGFTSGILYITGTNSPVFSETTTGDASRSEDASGDSEGENDPEANDDGGQQGTSDDAA